MEIIFSANVKMNLLKRMPVLVTNKASVSEQGKRANVQVLTKVSEMKKKKTKFCFYFWSLVFTKHFTQFAHIFLLRRLIPLGIHEMSEHDFAFVSFCRHLEWILTQSSFVKMRHTVVRIKLFV